MADGEWFWCLDHHKAEPYDGCKSDSRLGPYASKAEAERALKKVEERNDQWDNDPDWNDD